MRRLLFMSIPKSKRNKTSTDFFDKAIDLRAKIIEYISWDLGPSKRYTKNGEENEDYWILKRIRDDIYTAIQDVIYCISQADEIWINNLYEYNERRRYMTKAIGDLKYIIYELEFAIQNKYIKISKYTNLEEEIEAEITSIKKLEEI